MDIRSNRFSQYEYIRIFVRIKISYSSHYASKTNLTASSDSGEKASDSKCDKVQWSLDDSEMWNNKRNALLSFNANFNPLCCFQPVLQVFNFQAWNIMNQGWTPRPARPRPAGQRGCPAPPRAEKNDCCPAPQNTIAAQPRPAPPVEVVKLWGVCGAKWKL